MHMAQMSVQCDAGDGAIGLLAQIQAQQDAHLVQCHVHRPAQADKAQLVDIGIAIKTIAV